MEHVACEKRAERQRGKEEVLETRTEGRIVEEVLQRADQGMLNRVEKAM